MEIIFLDDFRHKARLEKYIKENCQSIPGEDMCEKINYLESYFKKVVDDYCNNKQDVENNKEVISAHKLLEIMKSFYEEYRTLNYYEDVNNGCCDFLKEFAHDIDQNYRKVTSSRKGQIDKEKILFIIKSIFEKRFEKNDTIRCTEAHGRVERNYLALYFEFNKYGYKRSLTLIQDNNGISILSEKTDFEESEEFLNKYHNQIENCFNILAKKKGFVPTSECVFDFPRFSVEISDEKFNGTVFVDSCGDVRFNISIKDDIYSQVFLFKDAIDCHIIKNNYEVLNKIPVTVSSIIEPIRSIVVSSLENEKKLINK